MTPAPRCASAGHHALDQPQRADRVGLEHVLQALDREVLERAGPAHRGVVDDGVELAGRGQGLLDRARVGDVEAEPLGRVDVIEQRRVPGSGDDVVAAARSARPRSPRRWPAPNR